MKTTHQNILGVRDETMDKKQRIGQYIKWQQLKVIRWL